MSIWLKEGAVEELKSLLGKGYTCSQISTALSFKYNVETSRNAVIGKIHRLGLPRPDSAIGRAASQRHRNRLAAKRDGRKTIFGSVRKTVNGKSQNIRIMEAVKAGATPKEISGQFGVSEFSVNGAITSFNVGAEQHDPILDVAAKPLLELLDGDCKWPSGDPQRADFGFCARPRVAGQPYCEGHCKRAYQPLPQPSKRPFVLFKPGVRLKEDA